MRLGGRRSGCCGATKPICTASSAACPNCLPARRGRGKGEPGRHCIFSRRSIWLRCRRRRCSREDRPCRRGACFAFSPHRRSCGRAAWRGLRPWPRRVRTQPPRPFPAHSPSALTTTSPGCASMNVAAAAKSRSCHRLQWEPPRVSSDPWRTSSNPRFQPLACDGPKKGNALLIGTTILTIIRHAFIPS